MLAVISVLCNCGVFGSCYRAFMALGSLLLLVGVAVRIRPPGNQFSYTCVLLSTSYSLDRC